MSNDVNLAKMDTIVIRRAWWRSIQSLSDEEAGQLIKALFAFAAGADPDLSGPRSRQIYEVMTAEIERRAARSAKDKRQRRR